jgi:hypothetical protein
MLELAGITVKEARKTIDASKRPISVAWQKTENAAEKKPPKNDEKFEQSESDEEEESSYDETTELDIDYLYETNKYEMCLEEIDRSLRAKEEEIDEDYFQLRLKKAQCLFQLGENSASLSVLDESATLIKSEFGELSYLFVECLVLKSRVCENSGDFSSSMKITKEVVALVAQLKAQEEEESEESE